jgi:hypothetical protein
MRIKWWVWSEQVSNIRLVQKIYTTRAVYLLSKISLRSSVGCLLADAIFLYWFCLFSFLITIHFLHCEFTPANGQPRCRRSQMRLAQPQPDETRVAAARRTSLEPPFPDELRSLRQHFRDASPLDSSEAAHLGFRRRRREITAHTLLTRIAPCADFLLDALSLHLRL